MKRIYLAATFFFVLSALALPVHAYVALETSGGTPIRWDDNSIPANWYLDEDGIPGFSLDSVQSALQASFNTWGNVECSYMQFEYKGTVDIDGSQAGTLTTDSQNVMIWINENEWPGEWTDAYAVTVPVFDTSSGHIMDSDILYNKNFSWSVAAEGEANKADLQNIATHEIGHFVGLDHPNILDATMYFGAAPGEISKRDLAADDIQGICSIYPITGVTGSPCESDNDCKNDRICLEHEESGGKICSASCECAPDCTPAFTCLDGQCLPPEPEIGQQGDPCGEETNAKICAENLLCLNDSTLGRAYCTKYCSDIPDCTDGWVCSFLMPMGSGRACTAKDDTVLNDGEAPEFSATITSFTADPISPVLPQTSVRLSCSATGESDLLYRFSVRQTGGEWTYLKTYSQQAETYWTAPQIGSYELRAEVKNDESTECSDAESSLNFSVVDQIATDGDTDGDAAIIAPDGDSDDGGNFEDGSGGCSQTSSSSLVFLLLLSMFAFYRRKRQRG